MHSGASAFLSGRVRDIVPMPFALLIHGHQLDRPPTSYFPLSSVTPLARHSSVSTLNLGLETSLAVIEHRPPNGLAAEWNALRYVYRVACRCHSNFTHVFHLCSVSFRPPVPIATEVSLSDAASKKECECERRQSISLRSHSWYRTHTFLRP